jgi:MFS superfamily sulfate permease-like transporter
MQRSPGDDTEPIRITLAQEVSFLNKAAIKETLHQLPEDSEVIIDANKSQYIDFDVLDMIRDFAGTRAPEKNIRVVLDGFKDQYKTNGNNGPEVATKKQKEPLHTSVDK